MSAKLLLPTQRLAIAKRYVAPEAGEFPARVAFLGDAADGGIRFQDADLMDLMKERVGEAGQADLKAHPPEFFSAQISTDELDSYYTRMHDGSLRNYAADAGTGRGVMVLNGHNTYEFGFGRSLTGTFTEGAGDAPPAVASSFFIPRGVRLNSVGNDDAIVGIRMGIITDVSIGYYRASYTCGIDGLNLFDLDCPHIPGWYYEDEEDDYGNKDGVGTLCFAWVMDARLAEYSLVYKGANPSATIIKLNMTRELERITESQRQLVLDHYKVMQPCRSWSLGDMKPLGRINLKEVREMEDGAARTDDGVVDPPVAEEQDPPTELEAEEAAVAADPPEAEATPPVELAVVDAGSERLARLLVDLGVPEGQDERWLVGHVADLRSRAEVGDRYRSELIDQALEEGVRAKGQAFRVEDYRGILAGLSIDGIKLMSDEWRGEAREKLGGGRRTVDVPKTEPTGHRQLPDYVYAG